MSKAQRKRDGLVSPSLAYSEVDVDSFCQMLRGIVSPAVDLGPAFLDVGSGCGHAVFAAVLAYPFEEATGVEILSDLVAVSTVEVLEARWKHDVAVELANVRSASISFLCLDAVLYDWSSYTCVFMSWTCFSESLRRRLAGICSEQLAPGTIVLTVTYALDCSAGGDFELLAVNAMRFSFGEATVYAQRRKKFFFSETAN